jgi:hypothetical protein
MRLILLDTNVVISAGLKPGSVPAPLPVDYRRILQGSGAAQICSIRLSSCMAGVPDRCEPTVARSRSVGLPNPRCKGRTISCAGTSVRSMVGDRKSEALSEGGPAWGSGGFARGVSGEAWDGELAHHQRWKSLDVRVPDARSSDPGNLPAKPASIPISYARCGLPCQP